MSISDAQRSRARERAGSCCEYCRLAQSGRLYRFHVDHIIATKHGGSDEDDNLCLACYKCNGYKGSNIAALESNDRRTNQALQSTPAGMGRSLYNQSRCDDHRADAGGSYNRRGPAVQ